MSDIQVMLVSKRSEQKKESSTLEAQKAINQIKITNNLIKEVSFNTTVNRFEYLQQLLHKQHNNFVATITELINKQKDVIRQMKGLQKEIKQLKMPAINFNRLIVQSNQLLKARNESNKNYKLSQGMLQALTKMQKELDNYQNSKSSAS